MSDGLADDDVFLDGQDLIKPDSLERPPESKRSPAMGRQAMQCPAGELTRAFAVGEATDRVHGGGLPSAVRADQSGDLAVRHYETEVVDGDYAAVPDGQSAHVQQVRPVTVAGPSRGQ